MATRSSGAAAPATLAAVAAFVAVLLFGLLATLTGLANPTFLVGLLGLDLCGLAIYFMFRAAVRWRAAQLEGRGVWAEPSFRWFLVTTAALSAWVFGVMATVDLTAATMVSSGLAVSVALLAAFSFLKARGPHGRLPPE